MSTIDNPAYPREKGELEAEGEYRWSKEAQTFERIGGFNGQGLSKREYACIHCGVPATGDPVLDAIIAEGNRIQKAMIDAPAINHDPFSPDLSQINLEPSHER